MNELEKQFVPYNESIELRKLGFDEPCLGFWINEDKMLIIEESKKSISEHTSQAPTYRQAFKYLLKKYSMYGIVIPTITMHWTFKTITVIEDMIEVPPYKHVDTYDYPTQEEAELECLRKLIEIAKK